MHLIHVLYKTYIHDDNIRMGMHRAQLITTSRDSPGLPLRVPAPATRDPRRPPPPAPRRRARQLVTVSSSRDIPPPRETIYPPHVER